MSSSLRQSANGRSASHRHGAPKHAAHQQNGALEVYAPHFAALYKIPQHDVFHIPPAHLNVTRLVLCAHFSPEAPCPVGNRCKFVHADVSHAEVCEIHVNYAYRTLDEVEYERFAAGQLLSVSQPNGKAPVVMIPSDCVLKTRALEVAQSRAAANGQSAAQQAAPRLSHCAHYYFNRTCHQGPKCQFVHAVYLDPRASRHQRAPVPHTQDHHDGRRGHQDDAHHHDDDDSDFVAPFAGAASGDYVPTTEQLSSRHHSGSSGSLVESAEVASDCESAGCASSAELHPVVSTPSSSLRASCRSQALSAHKYRYNPYDMVTAIVCM